MDFCFICFCTVIEEFEINSVDFAFQKTRVKTSKAIFIFYRRPVTFGGLGDGADGPACRAALRAASTELEKSLLCGLMAGAMWTVARVSGHGMRTNYACSHCGAAHEDKAHVLWECPEWDDARETWLPWLRDAAGAIPNLGPPDYWPSCLRKAGLFPLRLAQGVDRDLLDEFLYRLTLYGMYLAAPRGGGVSQGIGTQTADAVFTLGSSKIEVFKSYFFDIVNT